MINNAREDGGGSVRNLAAVVNMVGDCMSFDESEGIDDKSDLIYRSY